MPGWAADGGPYQESDNVTTSMTGISIAANGTHTHTFTTSNVAGHNHTFTTGATGVTTAHENMQPFLALNYIIKA